MNVNKFRRGQIWWFDNTYKYDGSVQGKTRPVIIMSNDMANAFSQNLIAVPCTSQVKRLDLMTHVQFSMNDIENVALCENLMSVNTAKLVEYIGTCDDALLSKIENSVLIALGLDNRVMHSMQLSDIFKETTGTIYEPYEVIDPIESPVEQDDSTDNSKLDLSKPPRKKRHRFTIDDKIRFLQDAETHDSDFMIKKYNLEDSSELAKRKWSFRKQLEKGNH